MGMLERGLSRAEKEQGDNGYAEKETVVLATAVLRPQDTEDVCDLVRPVHVRLVNSGLRPRIRRSIHSSGH
jgi:hypothetical protein